MKNQYNFIIGIALLVAVITGIIFDRFVDSLNKKEEELVSLEELIIDENATTNGEKFDFSDIVEEQVAADTTGPAIDLPIPSKKEFKQYKFNYEVAGISGVATLGLGLLIIAILNRKK